MTHEEIYLRYYADEADQALWHSTDPEFVFPPHQDPPYDRDRFLPVPPIPLKPTPAGCRATTICRKTTNRSARPCQDRWRNRCRQNRIP